ncbi:DoxX family protein [Streptomyces sp. ISL-12]|uniref:DoxX family protein n=1 Tax=Streptomyces sp. ISL-12 TaxID=2819177 RepID=UPI001BE7FAEA|nr:DoxX family protein [Streptomyces sp. ISL-12]MBT2414688.1 DoxX family protein [Streptomyces sp. ISL-12]
MHIVTMVMALLLCAVYVTAGLAKLAGAAVMRADAGRLGLSVRGQQGIGALEVLGGAGLALGVWYPPLTTGAAIGIILLMTGALLYHRRAGDPIGTAIPALVLGLAVALTAALDLAGR